LQYVKKMGVPALVVAAAFAVAFAMLASAPNAAEAARPGGTVYVQISGTPAEVASRPAREDPRPDAADTAVTTASISSDGSVTGTVFAASGDTSISCRDGNARCDIDPASGTTTVEVSVGTGAGEFYVTVGTTVLTVKVSAANPVAVVELKPMRKTLGTGDTTVITATPKNAAGATITGLTVTGYPVRGSLTPDTGVFAEQCSDNGGTPTDATDDTVIDCPTTLTANQHTRLGKYTSTLTAPATAGTSSVTVIVGGMTQTVDVPITGPITEVTAQSQYDAVQVGGTVLAKVSALDKEGRPVTQEAIASITAALPGPTGTAVSIKQDHEGDGSTDADESARKTAKYPDWCGDTPTTGNTGECTIAIGTTGAVRGTHKVTVTISGTKAAFDLTVAGPPAAIEIDAPSRVEPLSTSTITVTATDDTGFRVGSVPVTLRAIEGGGALLNPTDDSTRTKNGQKTFTYFASSSPGVATFYVKVGSGADAPTDTFAIQVGEAAAPEPEAPAAPSLDRTPASTGYTLVNFSGGSVAELDAALAEACGSSAAAYATNLGEYVGYLVGAPSVVNRAFNDLFADGIPANTPLLVGGCGS
jgi:hypothetical protein